MATGGRGLPLHEVNERAALTPAATLDGFLDPAPGGAAAGAWLETEPLSLVSPEVLIPALAGRLGGSGWPAWGDGSHGAARGDTLLARAPDAFWWPRTGVVADASGRVFEATAGEARTWSADLSRMPFVSATGAAGDVTLTPPAILPGLGPASVFMAFGGVRNYGHFILDCLPALLALHEAGVTRSHPPCAPPLAAWHRDLLTLAFGGELKVAERRDPILRVKDAAFSNLMNHFLHRPNAILLRLRSRILSRAPQADPRTSRRLYFTRRRFPQRLMLEEAALEVALRARGFQVLEPERLTPAQQVQAMRDCAVLVAPAGAALANALFLPPGAKVFEILPSNFASYWTRDLARLAGLDWFGYFCPSPLARRDEPLTARLKQGSRRVFGKYAFSFRLPLAPFLAFLDERL